MNQRPNVLWIFSDEHRAQAMGCSGDVNVSTPYLDKLADGGCRYEHAYSCAPLCSPFRACLLSGKYINEHGVHSLHIPLANQKLIAETMQEYGYRTSYYGKWHISGGAAPSHFVSGYYRKGFDEFVGWENSNRFFETTYCTDNDANPQKPQTLGGFQTDALTDLALEGLKKNIHQERPWFQIISYEAPHPPDVQDDTDIDEYCRQYAPADYLRRLEQREIVLRKNVSCSSEEMPRLIRRLKAYYAAIENLDDNIGRLCQYLERAGQLDNTIIFYFSDHGDFFGSHGRYGKTRAEEESSGIPLIVHWPAAIAPHQVRTELFSGVDIAPTMFGLLGLPVPSYCSGMDLSHQPLGQRGKDREALLIQFDRLFYNSHPTASRFRALVVPDYKYIYYQNGNREVLYDLKNDPYELENLAGRDNFQETRRTLKQQLLQTLYAVNDDFAQQIL